MSFNNAERFGGGVLYAENVIPRNKIKTSGVYYYKEELKIEDRN